MTEPTTPSLFAKPAKKAAPAPLADRMRPATFEDFVGQEELTGPGRILRRMAETKQLRSMIFWGPPGVGKTTLAKLLANSVEAHFITYSAVVSGIKEIKTVMADAEQQRRYYGRQTILFIDEIHRFNKAQQDAFLPYVERGDIVLLGATTENPSFEINSALLSRIKVIVLHPLKTEQLRTIIERALSDAEKGLGDLHLTLDEAGMDVLIRMSDGD